MNILKEAAAFAAAHSGVVAAGGFHPHEASRFRESDLDELREMYQKGRIRAIGEIGLDFFYDHSPRDVQREVCIRQMELAWELKAPVAYHIRDAHQEMLEIMKGMKARLTGGIIHCFSGSAEIAKEYLKLGYYISFAGPLTFKKAPRLQEAVKLVPKDRLLIETDSPYMAPEPVRGRRNEPANVRYVGLKMAELRGEKPEEVAAFTTENAMQVYGINS
jgi:TatD DNase family protein